MSLFERIFVNGKRKDADNNAKERIAQEIDYGEFEDNPFNRRDAGRWAIVDTEVGISDHKIHDIGALRYDGATFHKNDRKALEKFLNDGHVAYLCGHNIVHFDAKYLFHNAPAKRFLVDTLYLSPLLFPKRPYHRLVKDDKLISEQLNDPVNDCVKARDLLMDEIAHWNQLPERKRDIFAALLCREPEFEGFLRMVNARVSLHPALLADRILAEYKGSICAHADLSSIIQKWPCGLAYALALIGTGDGHSVTPGWVLHQFPEVEHVSRTLCHTRCKEGCEYCDSKLDIRHNLKQFFGFDNFRTYDGEPLQEQAAQAAADGKSLLAIFPTGGGKSLTFQLPALMEGKSVHGLTVVISPLQSLMKDQVDNLADRGITEAATINGMLDPISRSLAIRRVQNGEVSLLYIAPEMLRSKTIERILLARHVVRFVIDEAHCFSAWGQDFRVDYLYIGKFIREYRQKKFGGNSFNPIPVSCFTATAKQKVVQDICDYFNKELGINLQLFASSASRTNLRYSVIHVESDNDKYSRLRAIIEETDCPAIIYVSRTKRAVALAGKLTRDGLHALPYHGKMETEEKIRNQEAFMSGEAPVMVATSAFGMGVDKSDVGLVVHYDISDSLENYIQEAGRAGRDPHLDAKCFVLYNDKDLDNHFILLNQTKLSISEIQQVWKAIKDFTKSRRHVNCSALEIARRAGWDDSVLDIETRVRTALSALEQSGYIERGSNMPHVYATGITVKNMDEARQRITKSALFSEDEVENAVRVIKSLLSEKYIAKAQDSEAESRVDYLADILGFSKKEVISVVERMRQEGILADTLDITAFLQDISNTKKKPLQIFEHFAKLERYLLEHIPNDESPVSYKQLNDNAVRSGIEKSTEKSIRTLLYFLVITGYIKKREVDANNIIITKNLDDERIITRFEKRIDTCRYIIERLYALSEQKEKEEYATKGDAGQQKNDAVRFSVVQLLKEMKAGGQTQSLYFANLQLDDVEEALLYLAKIESLKLEGGFLVLYNAMHIRRIKEAKSRYKVDDYRMLDEFYKQKIQQIHIVGEYANQMVQDYDKALQYVHDYFQMDYKHFIKKYFKGEREAEIQRNITPTRYKKIFGTLSERQKEIINDKDSRCIVVAAGPGSGKTLVLVHKLASLLLLEDVKHEQLLMLTFSRASATNFKKRLIDLIGHSAYFVEIKTFHSFCFDLLGRIGNLEETDDVVKKAAEMINAGEAEPNRIRKTVLVIDEAQDMSRDEFALVTALMDANEEMRVITVGDDDQNIFAFRGSDSRYMFNLGKREGGRLIEMTENFRSARHVVDAANAFARSIRQRIKKTPIVSMSKEAGYVKVTRHSSQHLYEPVAEDVSHHNQGTTCVLTRTNEEAVILLALLCKRGLQAKLIQSADSFSIWNLAETKYFIKTIDARISTLKSPTITDELWQEAKRLTFEKYDDSTALPYLQQCLRTFEQTNPKRFYSDLCEFIFESPVEDFCEVSKEDIVVSTIHKAKGREYDNVYMLVDDPNYISDEILRQYYVAMTRAKQTLSIHTTCSLFSGMIDFCPSIDSFVTDKRNYDMPDEIVIQLSHKDIWLDYSKPYKREILSLKSGYRMAFCGEGFCIPKTGKQIARLSHKMKGELAEWEKKGYQVTDAAIRFIVAWKPKNAPEDESETAVVLAELQLRRTAKII